jgi:hypothetical protein
MDGDQIVKNKDATLKPVAVLDLMIIQGFFGVVFILGITSRLQFMPIFQ